MSGSSCASKAKFEPDVIDNYTGIRLCTKGQHWQRALGLLSKMWEEKLEPYAISNQTGVSACPGQQ